MKNILLINPMYEMETLRISDEEHVDVKADNMPLGLATVAALTPEDFHVDIWDEFVRGPIEKSGYLNTHTYDLIGVTSTRVTLMRGMEIGAFFHKQGVRAVIGGPGITGAPDRCLDQFDVLFIGEAELTWPQFLRDWQAGSFRSVYRQIEKPDLLLSPIPKWDSIVDDLDKYSMGGVQTTRGCPFDCEFCDVVYLNGRRQRHKPVERVLEEVRALQRLGLSSVYFADDNLVGDHRYAKELLRSLIPINNAFNKPLRFATQASIDAGRDEELLGLLADANFYEMLIGLESPNKESLKGIGKYNNLKGNMIDEIHKILSYGISVRGAFISGLDHDYIDVFDKQFEFIQKSFLPSLSLHMLNAPIGTKLWRRLREEDRVLDVFKITDKVTRRIITNVKPAHMTRIELMQGFKELYAKVFSWGSFKERMFGFISLVRRAPAVIQKEESIQGLLHLGPNLHLEPEACNAMSEIFRYAEEKAPYLLNRVKELVIQFTMYSQSARRLIPKLERQIELESSGALTFVSDSRPLTIPVSFRKAYKTLFPDMYRYVYINLTNKSNVPQVLVEIFVEFLVREAAFKKLEDHHKGILSEVAEAVCVRFNERSSQTHESIGSAQVVVPDFERLRLDEDILISVEQELALPDKQKKAIR